MAKAKEKIRMDKRLPALILKQLAKMEKDLKWLAQKSQVDYEELYQVVAENKGVLTEKMITGINEVLGSDFKLIKTKPKSTERDVRDDIIDYLKQNKRSLSWLAAETGINYSGLYQSCVQKIYMITDERLAIINKTLSTKFK